MTRNMMKFDVCIPTKKKLHAFSSDSQINRILIDHSTPLSKARTELMEQVATEWFIFLDDDVIIDRRWLDKIMKGIDAKTGAICGFAVTANPVVNLMRAFLILVRGTGCQRGFTSNALIRKKAVEGIVLTRKGRLEDLELQEKIRANGYEWKFAWAFAKHTKKGNKVLKEALADFKTLWVERGFVDALRMI